MTLTAQHIRDCCFVVARGDLNQDTYRQMKEIIDTAIEAKLKNVFVDCESVASVTTEVQRMMLQNSSKTTAAGVQLVFFSVSNEMMAILKQSGLDTVLNIVPTLQDAYQYSKWRKRSHHR